MKSKPEIQNDFLLNYSWSPTPDEKQHFQHFCDGIATPEVLAKVLDPNNHPASDKGRRYKPNIATLYAIKDQIIRDMYDFREKSGERDWFAEYDAEIEGWGCLYCCDGRVWDLIWVEKRWSLEDIGQCSICSNGNTLPRSEIIAKMEASKIPCMNIAAHLSLGIYVYRIKNGLELTQEGLTAFLAVMNKPEFAQPATVIDPEFPNASGKIPF